MSFSASIDAGNINSTGKINDSNFKFHYTVSANIAGQYPANVNALFAVDTFYAQKLHLYNDTLNASFKAIIKAPNLDPRQLDAYMSVDSINLNLKNKPYAFDSIMLRATTVNDIHTVVFRSPLADMDATGAFDYDKLGASVIQYINRYYKISDQPAQEFPKQQIVFNGVIKNNVFVTDMLPGLDYKDIHFKGSYASSYGDSALAMDIIVPGFTYNNYILNNGKIDVNSANGQIAYNLSAGAFRLNERYFMPLLSKVTWQMTVSILQHSPKIRGIKTGMD